MSQPMEPTLDEEGLLDGTTTIPEFTSDMSDWSTTTSEFISDDECYSDWTAAIGEFTSEKKGSPDSTTDPATIQKPRLVHVQKTSSSPFRFLSLPAELRNMIYKLLLVSNSPIRFRVRSSTSPPIMYCRSLGRDWSWSRSTLMLLVCRQIYYEASAILYRHNFFVVDSRRLNLLERFLNYIGPAKAGLLSHIYINYPIMETFPHCRPGEVKLQRDDLRSLRLLQQNCTNLRKLTLGKFVETPLRGFYDYFCVHINSADERPILHEYFVRVNAELQAITSLREVIVHLEGFNNAQVWVQEVLEEAMREFGWVFWPRRTS
ncbi:hypothetical protein F4803DRAFT_483990 [Xylaria telfairii]|nr:hypothetical protein F4803DRAFT_483990 [Xylaria telfairii]